jgi:hypothetical protein
MLVSEGVEVEVGSEVEGRSGRKVVSGQRQDDSGDRRGRRQCGTPEGAFGYSGSPDRGRDCTDMTAWATVDIRWCGLDYPFLLLFPPA